MFTYVNNAFALKIGSTAIEVDRNLMCIKNGHTMSNLNLNPIIDGFLYEIDQWDRKENNILEATLKGGEYSILLYVKENGIEYSISGRCGNIKELKLFPGTYLGDTVVKGFIPDHYNRIFTPFEKVRFAYSATAKEPQLNYGLTRLWVTSPAPKVLSFINRWEAENGEWWGLMIPGPLPVYEILADYDMANFQLTFSNYLGTAINSEFPKVIFEFGLKNGNSILDRYLNYYKEKGYIDENKKMYDWWARPIFCTWGEQEYREKSWDFQKNPLTKDTLLDWVENLENRTGSVDFNIIVDLPWFESIGDHGTHPGRFGGTGEFGKLIQLLKQKGHKVILWYTPLWVSPHAKIAEEHPEYLLKDYEGNFAKIENTEIFDYLYLFDLTKPEVKEHVKRVIRYILSDKEGCLDADGLKMDMNYYGPVAGKHAVHDDSWGIGDLFWYNTVKFIYEASVKHKEDVFITLSGAEPYLQKYAPSQRLNDLFDTDEPTNWYKRAYLVNKMLPGVIIDVDGWPSCRKKSEEYWMVSPTFGVPVTYHAYGFDSKEKLTHADYHRMKAAWKVYNNAPVTNDMEFYIDPENNIFHRKYVKGALKGFYSALAIMNRCLVTYNEECAMLASVCDMPVEIPVPEGRTVEKVTKLLNGTEHLVHYTYSDETHTVLFKVEDCGKGIDCFKVHLRKELGNAENQ